jgi:hypothetical protein
LFDYITEKYGEEVVLEKMEPKNYLHVFSDGKKRLLKKIIRFENTKNNKVFLVDPFDKTYTIWQMVDILDNCPEVVHVVKSQFPPKDFGRVGLTRGCYYPRYFQKYNNYIKDRQIVPIKDRTNDKLCFVGKHWCIRRKVLKYLGDSCVKPPRMQYGKFLEYNENLKISLCLPGNGNLCHREIECFGVGTPVLCPTLVNQLEDPLIPDFHYINVDVSIETRRARIAKEILKRYEQVKNDLDLLQYISDNAYAWYQKNVLQNPYSTLDIGFKKILT